MWETVATLGVTLLLAVSAAYVVLVLKPFDKLKNIDSTRTENIDEKRESLKNNTSSKQQLTATETTLSENINENQLIQEELEPEQDLFSNEVKVESPGIIVTTPYGDNTPTSDIDTDNTDEASYISDTEGNYSSISSNKFKRKRRSKIRRCKD